MADVTRRARQAGRGIGSRTSRAPLAARGTVYLIVLISVMIITIIGLSGLYATQVQARRAGEGASTQAARANAEAAVETGLALMEEDPNWRTTYGNGDWFKDRALGEGTLALSVRDPGDDDVADSNLDPVVLRGIGAHGDARQMVEVSVDAVPGAVGSLSSGAHAGRVMAFDGATVTADAALTSNDSIWASAADVRADVETAGTVIGSQYKAGVTEKASPRAMPISGSVIKSHADRATPITMDEIAQVSSNIAENGHANFSTNNWINYNCSIGHSTSSPKEGEGCLVATDRANYSAGPMLDLTASIENGQGYAVSVWVRPSLAASIVVELITESNDDGEVRRFTVGSAVAVMGWTEVTGTVTPTWDAEDGLSQAVLLVRTASLGTDLDVDCVTVVPTTLDPPVIEEVVLGPSVNPYGAGTTNAEGVYSIDCAGDDLVIRNCRIDGTLVLTDPGPGSLIEGSVAWSVPDVVPALVVSGDVTVSMSEVDLDENSYEVNFNPVGSGMESEDSDDSDKYVSRIAGLVYVSNDLKIGSRTEITAPVIAGRDLVFTGDDVKLTHAPAYVADPPPGFLGAARLILDRRSWTKVVD